MTPQEYNEYINDYLTVIENSRDIYSDGSIDSYIFAKDEAKDFMSNYKKTVLKEEYLDMAVPKTK